MREQLPLTLLKDAWERWAICRRAVGPLAIVGALLCLGSANVVVRATWHEVEDGVLWVMRPEGLVAAEIAPGTQAAAADLRPGDLLLAIDGRPVESADDVIRELHAGRQGTRLTYTVFRVGGQQLKEVTLEPVLAGNRTLYFLLAAIAIFTLVVGTSVRLRRPGDKATLHFFWLCAAFYGVFAFSFSGRFDRLDWTFYWADIVSLLLLPPLFVHFALEFPERQHAWVQNPERRVWLPLLYAPAVVLGVARVMAIERQPADGLLFSRRVEMIDRAELFYLGVGLVCGLAIMIRALTRVRSVTARRQLRWIVWGTTLGTVPFVVGYLLPFAAGFQPARSLEFLAIALGLVPLSFASAVVRYRLMDVEVIIKRGLVYVAAVAAIVAIYAMLLRLANAALLGGSDHHSSIIAILATLVVVLLARPVRDVIQTTLDRAYYRDRYDYRRALVGFARDLNGDLDLDRLSERLVARVTETLLIERMILMLAPPGDEREGDLGVIRAEGFDGGDVPRLSATSDLGRRLLAGETIALDDPFAVRGFSAAEVAFWRDCGMHYFVPCVAKEGTIAVMALGRKESGELLNSEDIALVAAVAGQVATALENGRLYRQLHLKAGELDRLREFSENIIESFNDGLIVIDLDDRVVRWNRGLERIYGVPRTAALGERLDAVIDPVFLETLRMARRNAKDGTTMFRVPLVSRHEEGGKRLLVNVATIPLRTPDGAREGTMVIVEDITSRVQLEEQLQISEKMASIGLLAAGVAHEVNTPLTGISSFTQMLLTGADPDDPKTRVLEKIEQQTFRAARIIHGLLNLARPTRVDEAGPVDLNAVVNDVLSLLGHQLHKARIRIRRDLSRQTPVVSGVEHKLQQVFLNVFLNARDAMPKGGWLSIATRIDGDKAAIEVADTGSGIPSENLSRIYDPFFTTKAMGEGTGLGLSITYGIVQEHGGTITCHSSVGHGTRFTLTLPLAATGGRSTEVAN